MAPGVLWVSSRIASPTSPSTTLTPTTFCNWYENQHIHEVTALPGVSRAARYETIPTQPHPQIWSAQAPWLTVYEMPDIAYRETDEFRGLDGQSRPSEELLEGVFKQARFDTRFYEEVDGSIGDVKGPAKFLVSWAAESVLASDLRSRLQKIDAFRRVRRYEVVNATTLDRFVRREEPVEQHLTLIEFDGEELPVGKVKEVMGSCGKEEVGWYRLKRVYDEKGGS